jgi:hypothetical protein
MHEAEGLHNLGRMEGADIPQSTVTVLPASSADMVNLGGSFLVAHDKSEVLSSWSACERLRMRVM